MFLAKFHVAKFIFYELEPHLPSFGDCNFSLHVRRVFCDWVNWTHWKEETNYEGILIWVLPKHRTAGLNRRLMNHEKLKIYIYIFLSRI